MFFAKKSQLESLEKEFQKLAAIVAELNAKMTPAPIKHRKTTEQLAESRARRLERNRKYAKEYYHRKKAEKQAANQSAAA